MSGRVSYLREYSAELADPFLYPDDGEGVECGPPEREVLGTVVRRLTLFTIPGERPRSVHRLRVGYVRWVALIWLTAPDLLAIKTQDQVAEGLGISRQAFAKHVKVLADQGIICGHR